VHQGTYININCGIYNVALIYKMTGLGWPFILAQLLQDFIRLSLHWVDADLGLNFEMMCF